MQNIRLDAGAAALLARLHGAGYAAYAVGGCVRDSLLGRTPQDWDLCTSARPEQVVALFGEGQCIPTGLQHGTVTIKYGGQLYEGTTDAPGGPSNAAGRINPTLGQPAGIDAGAQAGHEVVLVAVVDGALHKRRRAVRRVKALIGVGVSREVRVGGDLPAAQVDRLQPGADLLDGLVAGGRP